MKAHARKRQSGSVTDIVPEGTPTEVVEHRLSEEERTCDICGAVMEEIGKEVHRSLQMEPARFWIREDVYYTYACRSCEEEGSGSYYGPEIRDVFSVVPFGAGISAARAETVPTDNGQLGAEYLGYLAAPDL